MTTSPGTPGEQASGSDDLRWIYWFIGLVVVALAVIGLVTYSGEKADQEAQDKARELTQKLEQAGLPVPQDQDIITRSLGNDGGKVCEDPAAALRKATLYDHLTNGAAFVGRRPVIVDRDLIRGEALVLETYCPDELDEFRDEFGNLKFDDVVKD